MSTDFNGSLMHTIHLLYLGVQRRVEHILMEHGQVSFSQFLILAGFSCNSDSPITQARLAEHLLLTEATVSRHIQTLVRMEFLTKKQDSSNKKAYNLNLTPSGQEKFLHAKKLVLQELDKTFSSIGDKDKRSIVTHFTKIIGVLHEKR
jgi:DNA-binding MarR family transcriptional regulator